MSEIKFLTWRHPMRSYSSWGTRHHCPMEVGASGTVPIAYWQVVVVVVDPSTDQPINQSIGIFKVA